MTRSAQKEGERFFTEEAAKKLGKEWCLGPDQEKPDFIITEGEKQFGLEFTYLFAGPIGERGSHRKKVESDTQEAVNAVRAGYEKHDDTPLAVKFVGDMCSENVDEIVPTLLELKLSAKPFGYHEIIEVDKGKAKLRVHVTRALRADWFCVNHRAGAVDRKPVDRIAEAIKDKAKKLPRYRKNTGLNDIRLLIVADRRMNSGKLSLEESPTLDLRRFQVVYFYSYPECVSVFT